MRNFSSTLLATAAFSLILVGAGCTIKTSGTVTTPKETTTQTTVTTPEGTTKTTTVTKAALTCPSGTTAFVASTLNLEFCYPTQDDGGGAITVKEKIDGVVLSVNNIPTRKIAVVNMPAGKTAADYIKSTYVNSKIVTGMTCSVDASAWGTTKGTQYGINGEQNGEQGLDSSDACNDNGLFSGLLENLGGAVFINFPSAPSTLYILTGEQDALLGFKHTDEFQNSIQPKN